MIIKENDKSIKRYEKVLPSLTIKPGIVMKAKFRARHRVMFLHGKVTTEDSRVVELKTDNYLLNIYSLYLEEVLEDRSGNVIRTLHSGEFLCGVNAHDPIECWKAIRRYTTLPFSDIEGILEEEGYPNPNDFDSKCKAGISGLARYHNIIKRNNFNTSMVELIDVHEV